MILPLDPTELFANGKEDLDLYLPLDELVIRQNDLIRNSPTIRKAAESKLYSEDWQRRGVKNFVVKDRNNLKSLPLISGNNLLTMQEKGSRIKNSLFARPRIWITSKGTTGKKKWLPLTLNDVGNWYRRIKRINGMIGLKAVPGKLILAINEPMPKVSNAIPYLWEQVDYLSEKTCYEWIIVAMEMLPRNHWDKFVIKKQPQWFLSSVSDAFRLAKEMDTGKEGEIKSFLRNMEKGFFWGASMDGEMDLRSNLQATYGFNETFSIYLSAECREMYSECSAHNGLHFWMDGIIHEILLKNGETIFLDEAPSGDEGEYIFTNFTEALPLIRYRTGDRIRVIGTSPCACGLTHPRAVFLGREETPSIIH